MKYLALLLSLAACGSPFTGNIPPADSGSNEDGDPDVVTRPDAHGDARNDHDGRAIHHPDAGHEAGRDSGTADAPSGDVIQDSGRDVTPPPEDSGPDTGPCMTTTTTSSYDIFQGGSMFSDYPTPVECQCVSAYTCACLSKYATGCMSGDSPTGTCSTTGPGTIVVNCGP